MIRRVAITGPESTGKSTLAQKLAEHYHTVWVPEYAREYIDHLGRPYDLNDIIEIAKGQYNREEALAAKANGLLFCDTDFIVLKIWCEFKYKSCPPWILDKVNNHIYEIYLLPDIDLPWSYDPQREHPHLRALLFSLYENELKDRHLNFTIIKGEGDDRLEQAIVAVNGLLEGRKHQRR
jgi:NadR type nicotinamide-nucleotide adenylyltransferase